MRKYIIGGLIGMALALSTTAMAETVSNIGKKIAGEYVVKVDGKALSTKAIGVDGTTYVPLRVAADTFGYDADFQNKTVILTERSVETVTSTTPTETTTPETPVDTIESIKVQIKKLETRQSDIVSQMTSIRMKQVNGPLSEEDTKKYHELEAEGNAIINQIADLKAQLGN